MSKSSGSKSSDQRPRVPLYILLAKAFQPMAGDLVAARKPDAAPIAHVAQHPLQSADPPGAPDHPQVQADRQHPWHIRPFSPKLVERIDDIFGEMRCGGEPLSPL